jgi:hypothetical protein
MRAILVIFSLLFGCSTFAAQTFGTGEFKQAPIKLATLVKDAAQYKDKKVVVSGEVKEVCKKEGCWMKIEDQKVSLRTIMKNHGFKVPTEIENKTVLVEGTLVEKELPANAVKHYMRDEGKPEAEINKVTGPQKVFQFIADGVKLG